MMLAKLPEWMDDEFLEAAAAVLVFVAVAAAIFTLVTVRSLGTRIIVIALLGLGAYGAFLYREDLEDCAKTCDCSLMGEEVPVDDCALSAEE